MEMAEHGVVQSGRGDLLQSKWRVRGLPLLLEAQGTLLRAMEQGQVNTTSVDREVVEKTVGVGWSSVRRAPQSDSISQGDGRQPIVAEHVNVRAPISLRVKAGGTQPIVIPRR